MKLYLIDPETRTIEPWEYNGDYKTIAPTLGCHLFDVVRFNNKGDVVFVDDEGLIKGPTHFFRITGHYNPLAGKGIVAGTDEEGETIEPTVTLEWLENNVVFVQPLRINDKIVWIPA